MAVLQVFLLSIFLAVIPGFAQGTPPATTSSNALSILSQVAQKYADAKSFHLEATEELTRSNELSREWRKSIMSITVAPRGRYRYEGHGPFGSALSVSDGKTVWIYHYKEKLFTEKPAKPEMYLGIDRIAMQEQAMSQAEYVPKALADVAKELTSARLLPEESISIDGTPHRCIVVDYDASDVRKDMPEGKRQMLGSGTYWIDKDQMVIVKMERRSKSFMGRTGLPARIVFQNDVTTIFPVVDLNASEPDATFVFTPPSEAKLTDEFPEQKDLERRQAAMAAEKKANAELLGKAAPNVH